MDFHGFTRRELQSLCKKNKIPANSTNIAMADALGELVAVEGVEEILHSRQFEAPRTSNESPDRSDLTSPCVPTGGRSIRRRNVVIQESSTVKPMRSTQRTIQRSMNEDTDESQSEEIQTPSMAQPMRKKAPLNSVCREIDSQMKKCAEEKEDVSATPAQLGLTSQRRRVKKEETTVKQVYSIRRSARLAKKKGEMLDGEGYETYGLVQMDLISKYDPNVSACMKENLEDLEDISGITGHDMEKSDEVVSVPKQDLSVAHEAELLSAIGKGVDINFEVGGSKSPAKETSDVEMEKPGCKVVNEEIKDGDITKEEEIIIHPEAEAEAETEYLEDENIEEEIINYSEANITEYSKETGAVEIEEEGYNSQTEAALNQPTFGKSEHTDDKIIIVQQNVRAEVPEKQVSQQVHNSVEIAIVSTEEINPNDHVAFKDDAFDILDYAVLESGDNTEIGEVAREACIIKEIEKGINIDMVEQEFSLVEPSDGSHHSTCNLLVGDLSQEEGPTTEGRNEINLVKNAELELQQTRTEVLGTKVDTASMAQPMRKKAPLNSACREIDSQMKKCAEEKGDVSATPAQLGLTSQRRRVKKEETTVKQVYSIRRSARLAKKKGEMLDGEGYETYGLVQMDLISKYDPNVSACMKENLEDLEDISGITGHDMEKSEKEKSDEVVSMPKQDLSVAHEAELLAAIGKGVDINFEVGGSKSPAKETSDVEMEKPGCKIVNEEIKDGDITKEEEIIIHPEAESEYLEDENIEEEIINYSEANITEYSKETGAVEIEEEGYNLPALNQPTFEQSEDTEDKIIIVQQNVRAEVPEKQVEVHIDMVEKELSLVEPSDGSHQSTCDSLVGDLIQEEDPNEGRNEINLVKNVELVLQLTSKEILGTKLDTDSTASAENLQHQKAGTEVESIVVGVSMEGSGEGQSPYFAPKEINAASVELVNQKSPVFTRLDKHQFFKPARSTPTRESASKKRCSVVLYNKENIGNMSKLILTKEKPKMAKSSSAENVQGLSGFSRRQLEMSKNENDSNEAKAQTPARPALQALPENI